VAVWEHAAKDRGAHITDRIGEPWTETDFGLAGRLHSDGVGRILSVDREVKTEIPAEISRKVETVRLLRLSS
jgi:hypothetical protein